MSSAGPFILISNDGKQDKLIMATQLLNSRIQSIVAKKQEKRRLPANHPEALPSLMDIEQTHILYTLAYYKPFAAIAFCYQQGQASGAYNYGQSCRFQIPQFGDFFNDMVVKVKLNTPSVTYASVDDSLKPLGRWCDYPGERLFKSVNFSVNGQVLDQYTSNDAVIHRQQFVGPNKLTAWKRCMGQDVGVESSQVQDGAGLAHTDAKLSNVVTSKMYKGYQTPKVPNSSTQLEMYIPLLFWFNNSPRLSMPSAAIPNGMRDIVIQTATTSEMYGLVPRDSSQAAIDAVNNSSLTWDTSAVEFSLIINNLFVLPEIHNIYIKRVTFTLIRVHLSHREELNRATNNVLLSQLKYPIEYITFGLRPKDNHDASTTNPGSHLDKWHKFHSVERTVTSTPHSKTVVKTVTAALATGGAVTVSSPAALTFAVPVGTVAVFGVSAGTVVGTVTTAGAVGGTTFTVNTGTGTASSGTVYLYLNVPESYNYDAQVDTITTLGLKSHGVEIYSAHTSKFYNSYLPLHYGGEVLTASEDAGLLFMPFCLYPGAYQPSGHINMSRARECNAEVKSDWIGAAGQGETRTADFVASASAINFLLVADGSCVLRFNT